MPAHVHSLAASNVGSGNYGGGDTLNAQGSMNTGSKGGGGAHSNVQPYIVVYMWKRTA